MHNILTSDDIHIYGNASDEEAVNVALNIFANHSTRVRPNNTCDYLTHEIMIDDEEHWVSDINPFSLEILGSPLYRDVDHAKWMYKIHDAVQLDNHIQDFVAVYKKPKDIVGSRISYKESELTIIETMLDDLAEPTNTTVVTEEAFDFHKAKLIATIDRIGEACGKVDECVDIVQYIEDNFDKDDLVFGFKDTPLETFELADGTFTPASIKNIIVQFKRETDIPVLKDGKVTYKRYLPSTITSSDKVSFMTDLMEIIRYVHRLWDMSSPGDGIDVDFSYFKKYF